MSGVPGYTPGTLNAPVNKMSKTARKRMNKQKRKEEEQVTKVAEIIENEQNLNDGDTIKSVATKAEIIPVGKNLSADLKTDEKVSIDGKIEKNLSDKLSLSPDASEFKPSPVHSQQTQVQTTKQQDQKQQTQEQQQENPQQHHADQQKVVQPASLNQQRPQSQQRQRPQEAPKNRFDNSRNQQRQWSNNRDPYDTAKTYDYHGDYFQISKELVRILRHGKYKWIKMDDNGFCYVDDITHCRKFLDQFGRIDFRIIKDIVDTNDKKRFVLKQDDTGEWKISAAQGHSLKLQSLSLERLTDPKQYDVVHGTYTENWNSIKVNGLNRMNRMHIHFAIGLPDNADVVSGMRRTCDIVIKMDMEKAMKDGLKFFVSSNKVILSEGDSQGRIHPKYFNIVMRVYPKRQKLDFEIPPDYPEREKVIKIAKDSPRKFEN